MDKGNRIGKENEQLPSRSVEYTLQRGGILRVTREFYGLSSTPYAMITIEDPEDKKSNLLGCDLGYLPLEVALQSAFSDYSAPRIPHDRSPTVSYMVEPPDKEECRAIPHSDPSKRRGVLDELVMTQNGRLVCLQQRTTGDYVFTAERDKVYSASGKTIVEAMQRLSEILRNL